MAVNDLMENKEERPAYIRFEIRAVKDPQATMKAGHYKSRDVDYVLVSALGSTDFMPKKAAKWFTEVEKSVERGRIPMQHLELYREIYARWKKGQEPPVNGTSIKDWNALSPSQCANMFRCGIKTIEDMAQLPAEGMKHIGAGALDLKNKANAWLQSGKDNGPLIEELAALKKQNEQLQGSLKSLQDQINRFRVQSDAQKEYVPMDHSPQTFAPTVDDPPEVRYEAKFGKPPHHRMKTETILKALQE